MTARRGGFTLVDLVAVLAIILVVAAILFPIFAQSRGGSRRGCLSHVKQLGTGMMMYLQDHDGVFPPKNDEGAPGQSWDDRLFPYVKYEGYFRCPNVENPEKKNVAPARVRHYALNAGIYGKRRWDGEESTKSAAVIRFPETTVLLCEAGYQVRESWDRNRILNRILGPRKREYRVPLAVNGPERGNAEERDGWKPLGEPAAVRHQGGSNYVFADGHAKWFSPEAVRDGSVPNDGKNPGFGL